MLELPAREPDFDLGPSIPRVILKGLGAGDTNDGYLESLEAVLLVPEKTQPWLYRAFCWEKQRTPPEQEKTR